MKENYILLYLMITINTCFCLFSMEESIQNWVFIKNTPGAADKEDFDWRIKNGKLELNLNAPEAMTQQTFAKLIADRKKEKLPFLLLMIRSGDKGQFIHFFDGSVIKTIMSGWKMTNILTDPLNKQEITKIEIYAAGDDGKLRRLNDNVTPMYLQDFFVDPKGYVDDLSTGIRTYNYELKPELTTPGVAQALIAGLYEDESRDRTYFKREFGKHLEKSYDSEGERLLQIERLWLSWSLDKFSSEYAQQKNAASTRMNEIKYKPHYLPN